MALMSEVFLLGKDHENKATEIGYHLNPSSLPQVIYYQLFPHKNSTGL